MTKEYYKTFGILPVKNKKELENHELKNLYRIPKKDKGNEMPHIQVLTKNIVNQADILFLPNDNGYKYSLVVTDPYDGTTDAQPLKNKSSKDVLEAFLTIYKRNNLNFPKRLEVDSGTEFKGDVKKYFNEHGCFVRYGKVGRHRQQASVERKNQTIGTALLKRMTAQELLTGEVSKEWTEDLPKMIRAINKKAKPKKINDKGPLINKKTELLLIGTKVRAILDEPRNVYDGDKLHGKFRSSDIRFNPKIRTVKEILIKPGFPPMYLLDGDVGDRHVEPVAYTFNQLQKVPTNEVDPNPIVIRGKPNKYVIKKIIDKKKIKGKINYKILWKGFDESAATWEPRNKLIKEVPKLIEEYEKSQSRNIKNII